VSAMAASIFQDLRERRLLPVAALLLVAAVALPLLALKSSSEPAATPQAAAPATPAGLPSPQQALSDKPLVSLAVLEGSTSNLDEFESKNPFKPLDTVSSDGAGSDTPSATPDNTAGSGTATGGGGSTGGTDTGGSTGGGGGGGGQQQTPAPDTQSPKQDDDTTPEPQKKMTFAVDLTVRGPKGLRSYRGLPKLSVLPAQDNPLFVFLGVEDAGTKAVFLVDAKLTSVEGGDGTCTPLPTQCATLALAPGESHEFHNEQGQTWTITIVEVRETSVAKAAAAARKAQKRRARQARQATTSVGDNQIPRFVPPMITDLFTGGRS
jgi:hypothetical protein